MLINCAVYQHGSKLHDISVEAISDYVARPDCFVWVALRDASPEELALMQEEFHLPSLAVEDAHHGHQRPKLEEYGETLFAVMHLLEPSPEGYELGEVNVFVGRNYILTVRNRNQQAFLGVRARCEQEPQLLQLGAGFVFYALMDAVVDRYFPLIDSLETDLEAVEERIFAKGAQPRDNIEQLYGLKRRVMTLKHAVAPLMEVAGKLHGGRVPPICISSQDYFRDVHDHLIRINSALDTLRDTITTAIQVNLSLVTIEEGEVNKRLAAWAGIFATATAFAGIWGMNFRHMPELDWPWGYPLALGLIAGTCGILYRRFRKAGWL
ncbi:magnesium and cobalt transport protein CorA [Azovibrio restrictus]|uniref:magnesium and cobalt transport protein CorA n=1 Tax=Azovibrio restrictus TaxID=146938 RepID=UPI0026E9DF22|nr:magnesium and cobalt transport protein CorA [Azovibrio restrictus]